MIAPLHDEFLLIRNGPPFLILAHPSERFSLCIETESEEYCQTLGPADLIVVSAPEGGAIEAGVMLIELVRTHHTPLIVLPTGHPGSRRLRYVISAGPVIETSCSIRRGTHPEQHLICASEALSGIVLKGLDRGVKISNLPPDSVISYFQTTLQTEFLKNPKQTIR